jgi:hypothetical protein
MADIKLDIDVNAAPVDRAIRLLDNLEAELRDVQRAEKAGLIGKERLTAETKRLNNQMSRLKSVAGGSAKDFRVFEKAIYGSGKALRAKEVQMQQAGYQLQDFIVQVQAGTNPMIAFSQQGSQLAGFFAGPWGAAIGLGIAALGGLGTALLGSGSKAKSLQENIEDLSDAFDRWKEVSETSAIDQVNESFGRTSPLLVQIQRELNNLAKIKALDSLNEALGGLRGQFQGFRSELQLIANVFETRVLSKPTARIRDSLKDLENEAIPITDRLKTALDLKETFLGNVGGVENLTEAQETFYQSLLKVIQRIEQAKELSKTALDPDPLTAFGGAGPSQEQIKASLQITNDLVNERIETEKGYNRVRSALEDAYRNKLVEEEQKTKAIVRDRITVTAALQAAATTKTRKDSIAALAEITQEAIDSANLEIDLNKKVNAEKKNDLIDTINFQFSLVEDTLDKLKDSQDELNDSAEELGKRLGIGFEEALDIIRRAKAEATVDLDAFGGIGDFKYSVPTSFKPEEEQKSRVKDLLGELRKQLNVEEALIGKTEARQRVIQALGLDYEKYGKATINSLEAQINRTIMLQQAENKRIEELEKAKQQQKEIADTIAGSMGDAFMSIVDGTKSVKDAFRDMARYIIGRLYEILVVEQMVQSISGAIQGAMIGPVQGPMLPSANGNVFSNGSVVPYANGGVVGSPVYFPMSGGRTGLMGEAGPEAIMPLKRGKNGKLGVQADGGGDITINQSFNFSANGDESVKKIIAQQAPKIAQMTQQQIMDSRRRGGQMKAVFG